MPLREDFALMKLDIRIGDRQIEGKILPKGKAQEKYDDAIAAGHTSALGTETTNSRMSLLLGNMLPMKPIFISYHMVAMLKVEN